MNKNHEGWSRPLDAKQLATRVDESTYALYSNISALLKSGVGVLAATTLIRIGENWEGAVDQLLPLFIRMILWISSSLLTFVTFITWSRGSILATSRRNTRDYIFPMLVGFFEFIMFIVLDPVTMKNVQMSKILTLWFVAEMFHALSSWCLIVNRLKQFDPKTDFADNLQDLGKQYRQWMERNRKITLVIWLSSIVVIFWSFSWWYDIQSEKIFAVSSAALFTFGLITISVFRTTKFEWWDIQNAVTRIPEDPQKHGGVGHRVFAGSVGALRFIVTKFLHKRRFY